MPLKLVVDECVDYRIVVKLKENKFNVLSVHQKYRGLDDHEILEVTTSEEGILLTEDKDFGEWIFAHKVKAGVILLRYSADEIDKIIQSLIHVLNRYGEKLKRKFAVITPKKIRVREI